MISGLKLKIIAIIITASLFSAAAYWYISIQAIDNGNGSFDDDIDLNITAIQAINITKDYMDLKYPKYNLTKIQKVSTDNWEVIYLIEDGETIIRENIWVNPNGTYSPNTETYEKQQAHNIFIDVVGFDIDSVKIDSDYATEIMLDNYPFEIDYYSFLSLYLEGSYSLTPNPMWVGRFDAFNRSRQVTMKLNATTGELIDVYAAQNVNGYISSNNNSFNGSRITALKGLSLASYYMSSNYSEYDILSISDKYGSSDTNETGYNHEWLYNFVTKDSIREIVNDYITVYSNGTIFWEWNVFEFEDREEIHGYIPTKGFNIEDIVIDSDDAIVKMIDFSLYDSWWDGNYIFTLELETWGTPPTKANWIIEYVIYDNDNNYIERFDFKIDPNTGYISSYSP